MHDRNFGKLTGMRFVVICLLAAFCLLFVPASVHAEEIGELSGTWYINDETGYKIELHDDASLLEESELQRNWQGEYEGAGQSTVLWDFSLLYRRIQNLRACTFSV